MPRNFNGTDTFTYTINDPNGVPSTATVTVFVDASGEPPPGPGPSPPRMRNLDRGGIAEEAVEKGSPTGSVVSALFSFGDLPRDLIVSTLHSATGESPVRLRDRFFFAIAHSSSSSGLRAPKEEFDSSFWEAASVEDALFGWSDDDLTILDKEAMFLEAADALEPSPKPVSR